MLKSIILALSMLVIVVPNLPKDNQQNSHSQLQNVKDIFGDGGILHGSFTYDAQYTKESVSIAIPDIKLQLLSVTTNAVVAEVTTDIFGRYYFPKVKPDTYVITWDRQNGWEAGKSEKVYDLKNYIQYAAVLHPIPIKGYNVFTGTISMKNGSAAYFNEYYGIQSMPIITDESKSVKQRTNVSGQFALSTMTRSMVVSLYNQNYQFSLISGQYAAYPIKNTLPVALGFELSNNAGKIKYAKSGEKISLRELVQDLDGDILSYKWEVTGAINKKFTGQSFSLKMPKGEGTIIAEVVVEDRKGGIVIDRFVFGYGQKHEIFSGVVKERQDGTPVKDVEISINSVKTKTDGNGHFRTLVPIAKEYALTIQKLGYTTYGQSYEYGQKGKEYNIRKLKTTVIDASTNIVLNDGNAVLNVPKNSLVDSQGKRPSGALNANFAVLDIANNEFPGDFIGRDREGQKSLISYGMAEISFYDNKGKKFNLRKGLKATLTLPVAGSKEKRILEKAPSTIPIWTYNAKTGEWDRNGVATLNKQNGTYTGTLDHFSTINMDQPGAATCIRVLSDPVLLDKYLRVSDVIGDGIDYATVKETQINNALSAIYRLPPSQKVRIEVLDGPGGSVIGDVFIDVFDNAQPGLGWVINPNNEVTAGTALADLWPIYPYATCPLTIHLKFQPNANPETPNNTFLSFKSIGSDVNATNYYAAVDVGNFRTTLNAWLTHNGYTVAAGDISYGTNTDPSRYFNTAFLNNNDLGSGRDMHFLKNIDGTASAYVANYGKFDQNHDNADKAELREFLAGDVIATVCMEYSPLDNAANQWIDNLGLPFNKEVGPVFSAGYLTKVANSSVVKFFVYTQNALGGGTVRQKSANLDGYQNKFVPNLCFNCHGGSPSDFFEGVHFRELDYRTYKFSGGRLHTSITNTERDSFKGQNEIVKTSSTANISSPAIKELIDLWYNDLDNVQQIIIPNNWKKTTFPADFPLVTDHPERLYTNVVGKSCRTCHVAFDNPSSDLGFDNYFDFLGRKLSVSFYTTNPGSGVMPHAVITHRNFWTDNELELDENGTEIGGLFINRAYYLRHYIDSQWTPALE